MPASGQLHFLDHFAFTIFRPPDDSNLQSFAPKLEEISSFSAQAHAQSLTELAKCSGLSHTGVSRILLPMLSLLENIRKSCSIAEPAATHIVYLMHVTTHKTLNTSLGVG